MNRILICGYHGYDNCGDEALLKVILEEVRHRYPNTQFTVLSGNPEETASTYQVDAIYRYHLAEIFQALKHTDLLLFGGGGLLQDITSSKSLYYYLLVLTFARIRKVKTIVFGNGMGPFLHSFNRKMIRMCLNKVDVITVRDQNSADLLKEIGVDRRTVHVTADPVLGWKNWEKDKHETVFSKMYGRTGELLVNSDGSMGGPYAAIAVRNWKNADPEFEEKIAVICDRLKNAYGLTPVFVPMQFETDHPVSQNILEKMDMEGYLPRQPLTIEETRNLISKASVVIGMRLHSLIFAVLHNIPVLALSYDPKVEGFMKRIEQPYCMNVETIDAAKLSNILEEIMEQKTEIKESLNQQLISLQKGAEKNLILLDELLNRKTEAKTKRK